MAITKVTDPSSLPLTTADYQNQNIQIKVNSVGLSKITISNYDNDSAPAVKVGSLFDCGGTIYSIDTADETPTGYSGISVSTTFYLYFENSTETFIYSSTAPTWNDAYQGWYNGSDRALFSMYKDSGGTLYQDKNLLLAQNNLETSNNLTVGNDLIVNNDLEIANNLTVAGYATYDSKMITSTNYIHGSYTSNDVFDALSSFIPNNGDTILVSGGYSDLTYQTIISRATRFDATTIYLYGLRSDNNEVIVSIVDGNTTANNISLSW